MIQPMQNMNSPTVQQNTNSPMGQQNMTPSQMALLQQQYSTMNNQFGVQNQQSVQGNMPLVNKLFQDEGGQLNIPSGGTSISDLKKMQPLVSNNQQRLLSQQQKLQQSRNMKRESSDYGTIEQQGPSDSDQERDKIKYLVKDINKSLDDYGPSKMKNTEDSDDDDYTEKEEDIKKNKKPEEYGYIMEYIKEPLLVIIIYVVLSQAFVRKSIANYIPLINPREDGSVSFLAYVIYGTLLALVFMFFKKILIK
jgi:hypothetical protein